MSRTTLRTLVLKERVPRDVSLSAADVAFLQASHRTHVELTPAASRGRFQLTPAGHVGTIVCPRCRLYIRPKLPLENLFHLLDPSGPMALIEDRSAASRGTEALDFLAGRLARMVDEQSAAGLHRAYAERTVQGPFLQGRLDIPAQLRDAGGQKVQLHSHYEDFTPDIPCNQVPKATAELVLRSPLLGDGARTSLRRSLRALGPVSSVSLTPESFAAATADRLTETYRPLLEVCRVLADGLKPGVLAGETSCPAFLLDMERVYEGYVAHGIAHAFGGDSQLGVALQQQYTASEPVVGQPDLRLRPDVTIEREGRPLLVVDTKWKRLCGSPLVTEDVYQMLAYCTGLGVNRAVLVYPGRRDRVRTYQLMHAQITIDVRTLRVVGARDQCRRSLRRLAKALLRHVGER
jgi:5-methylcytosine-specific restriction enzyme subunit McrC